ncbi:aldo/keto reductase [Streptomyces sp. NPDC058412]|uniref:aldo/keto reductase n=1 Tax=Streptomyces sp. NPDC058412 TaxID=3346486 RepID=UPI0036697CD9
MNGTMTFGTTVDEATAYAILDRFAEAGGTFVDTSNNYAFWVNGTQGGESEELVGRWLRSRGVGDGITVATKLGARPNLADRPSTSRLKPLEETVRGFAEVVADGTAGLLGASNHWAWRVERARTLAAAAGVPGYEVLQHHHSYLRQRTDVPSLRSPDGNQGLVSGDLLSYLRDTPSLTQVAYSPLIGASSVAQLEENLGAVDLDLTAEQRARLDSVN